MKEAPRTSTVQTASAIVRTERNLTVNFGGGRRRRKHKIARPIAHASLPVPRTDFQVRHPGDPIGQFTATFYLAEFGPNGAPTNDFENWEDFQRLIESMTNGPTPIALPIYHPDLARNKFAEVSSGGVGGLVHDGNGGATVTVKFIEYKPPKPKPAAVAKAKPGGGKAAAPGKPAKPDPNAAAKAELAQLTALARQP